MIEREAALEVAARHAPAGHAVDDAGSRELPSAEQLPGGACAAFRSLALPAGARHLPHPLVGEVENLPDVAHRPPDDHRLHDRFLRSLRFLGELHHLAPQSVDLLDVLPGGFGEGQDLPDLGGLGRITLPENQCFTDASPGLREPPAERVALGILAHGCDPLVRAIAMLEDNGVGVPSHRFPSIPRRGRE